MKYVSVDDILVIHASIIDATGGSHGVRDVPLLLSIVERPKMKVMSKFLYRGTFEKAATYLDGIVHYHVFVDGNKRTAIAVAARFLFLNGYELAATNKEIEKYVLHVVAQKPDVKDISKWLKKDVVKKK